MDYEKWLAEHNAHGEALVKQLREDACRRIIKEVEQRVSLTGAIARCESELSRMMIALVALEQKMDYTAQPDKPMTNWDYIQSLPEEERKIPECFEIRKTFPAGSCRSYPCNKCTVRWLNLPHNHDA